MFELAPQQETPVSASVHRYVQKLHQRKATITLNMFRAFLFRQKPTCLVICGRYAGQASRDGVQTGYSRPSITLQAMQTHKRTAPPPLITDCMAVQESCRTGGGGGAGGSQLLTPSENPERTIAKCQERNRFLWFEAPFVSHTRSSHGDIARTQALLHCSTNPNVILLKIALEKIRCEYISQQVLLRDVLIRFVPAYLPQRRSPLKKPESVF